MINSALPLDLNDTVFHLISTSALKIKLQKIYYNVNTWNTEWTQNELEYKWHKKLSQCFVKLLELWKLTDKVIQTRKHDERFMMRLHAWKPFKNARRYWKFLEKILICVMPFGIKRPVAKKLGLLVVYIVCCKHFKMCLRRYFSWPVPIKLPRKSNSRSHDP